MARDLDRVSQADYGDRYRDHMLEIYKLYVLSAEKISDRRLISNSFFLTLNTAIFGGLAYAVGRSNLMLAVVFSGAGALLCVVWNRSIRSYNDLNSAKYKVVHELESRLPVAAWDREWDLLSRGKEPGVHLPLTKLELIVPWIFFWSYVGAMLLVACVGGW